MASLQDLIAQKEALEREIERTKQQGRTDALAQIRALMAEYGLSAADLAGKSGKASKGKSAKGKGGGKVPAKYRDSSTGETWSGRGLQPRWLKAALAAGRKLDEFAL
jgi:DNA-binding protein H-NS